MSSAVAYALVGVGLFGLGLYGVMAYAHLLRKILALNIIGSGVFLFAVALGNRSDAGLSGPVLSDPVPQAMVITGIVVAVSATALALGLMLKLAAANASADLPDHRQEKC